MNAYESDLGKAYTLSPNDPEITERYGYLLIDNKNEIGATLIFKALENKYSTNDPRYYLSWADALVYLDDEGLYGRERILSECIKLFPDFITAYFELAYLYREKGDFAKSLQLYKEIYEMSPDNFRAANELAWAYFWSKEYDSAIQYWSGYKEYESRFSDTTQRVAFRHRLGMTYAVIGDKKKADRLFSEQLMIINGMIAKQQSRGIWGSSMAGLYFDLAVCEAYFGNKDKMIAALDSAYFRYHFFWNWGLNHEPVWEQYRTDEKLIALKNRNNEIVEFKKRAFQKALAKSKVNDKIKVLLN
jgi:tetratricopeptide (TPR) repeat protein